MKWIKHWILALILFVIPADGQMLAQDLQKPFAVDYDTYNFNIKMDSWVITPRYTSYKFQLDVSLLPESEKLQNLPAIYVTDGQWRRMDHKYIHYLTRKKMIPPVVVIGIGYPEEYDASQVRITDLISQSGNFLVELEKEIIPQVEKKYSIDPRQRFLFGASAGGYFTVYSFLMNSLNSDPAFRGYIGSSSYLPRTDAMSLAKELASRERELDSYLYLAYGAKENYFDFAVPNNHLYKILENKNIKKLRFWHHVYPDSDHFTNTRLTLIDGLRLFLGNERAKGIGAIDLKYKSYRYDFKTNTQVFDWNTNIFARNSWATEPRYSHGEDPSSFKVAVDFTKYDSLNFQTSSVYFEGLADRELEFNIYIPEDFAKLNYQLRFLIFSTNSNSLQWITDTSKPFKFTRSGWNTFRYQWRGKLISGNINCIRGFGVVVERPKSAPAWRGNLYFDDIQW
jgi:enterochelin esterase-like enzyme